MTSNKTPSWRICVDTGGTFTDCIAIDPDGGEHRAKVLSSSSLRGTITERIGERHYRVSQKWNAPDDFVRGCRLRVLGQSGEGTLITSFRAPDSELTLEAEPEALKPRMSFEVVSGEEAPVLAARLVTQTPFGSPMPGIELRLATTRGTNALLEGKGEPPVLFITRGFRDLLEIGTQARPELFALNIVKPGQLYGAVVEVNERLDAQGNVLHALDCAPLREECARLVASGFRVAAIALMHSYLNPSHEEQLRAFLLEAGFERVSSSAALSPAIRLLPRAQTAVTDAYLGPVIERYLSSVRRGVGTTSMKRLHVMSSAGGLQSPESYHARDSLLSGPAGGVVGSATSARRSGHSRVIAFDMGGTSTDVSRFDGDYVYVFEHRVGNAHLLAPALAIETVAAGGGSICGFRNGQLFVGPESAGADPGPACYGAGGPLTITDVNLLLGRLYEREFEIPISRDDAEQRLAAILDALHQATGQEMSRERLLSGFLQLANERMADAIRRISVSEGCDPADYAMVSFGGAGGQHACALADLLGIRTILAPGDASLLSAYGLMHAVIERFAERQVLRSLDACRTTLDALVKELSAEALNAVISEGVPPEEAIVRRRMVNARLAGQDSTLTLEYKGTDALAHAFQSRFEDLFGYYPEGKIIEVESVRVAASRTAEFESTPCIESPSRQAESTGVAHCWIDERLEQVPVYPRSLLNAGDSCSGPAMYADRHTSVFVEQGWSFTMDAAGTLVLKREGDR